MAGGCDTPTAGMKCCSDYCKQYTQGKGHWAKQCAANEQSTDICPGGGFNLLCSQGQKCCYPAPTTVQPNWGTPGSGTSGSGSTGSGTSGSTGSGTTGSTVTGNQTCVSNGGYCLYSANGDCGSGATYMGMCDANDICCKSDTAGTAPVNLGGTVAPAPAGQSSMNQTCVNGGGRCEASCGQGGTPLFQCDGNDVCCLYDTKSTPIATELSKQCFAKNGSCNANACPAGTVQDGVCDSNPGLDAGPMLCCLGAASKAAAAEPTGNAGFDGTRKQYGLDDPLQLAGKNKISTLVARVIGNLLPLVGAGFLVIIIWAGVEWITAGGEAKKIAHAKARLVNSVIGMVIVTFAYAFVSQVIKILGAGLGN
jgi:hypothetical protein